MENTIKETRLSDHYKSLTGPIRYHLTNDYMFRAVMQKNENVLKHLLCSILGIPVTSVTELEIKNPIVLGEEIDSKTCILDIKLLINNNHYYNIEMQVSKQKYWKERSITYLCKTYNNLESGREYAEVIPAIQISILDFDLFEGVEELCSRYYLMNENPLYHNRYTDGFGIFTLNLLQIQNEKVIEKEKDRELFQWAQVFKADSWEEIRMLAQKNEAIDECIYTMAQLSEDEKIRMQCEARKDFIAIEKGLYSRGLRQGRQEGEELKLINQVCRKLQKGKTPDKIADDLEEDISKIQKICDVVENCGNRYDVEEIYDELNRRV